MELPDADLKISAPGKWQPDGQHSECQGQSQGVSGQANPESDREVGI